MDGWAGEWEGGREDRWNVAGRRIDGDLCDISEERELPLLSALHTSSLSKGLAQRTSVQSPLNKTDGDPGKETDQPKPKERRETRMQERREMGRKGQWEAEGQCDGGRTECG